MSATKPATEEEMRDFALQLAAACKDHAAWLAFIRYGLGFLLENQPLLIELIVCEAGRETDRQGAKGSTVEATRRILDELGLRLMA